MSREPDGLSSLSLTHEQNHLRGNGEAKEVATDLYCHYSLAILKRLILILELFVFLLHLEAPSKLVLYLAQLDRLELCQ